MRSVKILDLAYAFLKVGRIFHQLHRFAGVVAPLDDVLEVEYHALHGGVEGSACGGQLRELTDGYAAQDSQDSKIQIGSEIPECSHHDVQDVQRILFVHLLHVKLQMALQLLSCLCNKRRSRAVKPDILCEADILLLVVDVVTHAVHL